MNFHVTGIPAVFFLVPFFIGVIVCLIGGVYLGLAIVMFFTDKITEKLIRQFRVYDAVFAIAKERYLQRMKK